MVRCSFEEYRAMPHTGNYILENVLELDIL